ncbi:MAG: L,D-transpeptidase [Hyphomicrobiaceae bacterium]
MYYGVVSAAIFAAVGLVAPTTAAAQFAQGPSAQRLLPQQPIALRGERRTSATRPSNRAQSRTNRQQSTSQQSRSSSKRTSSRDTTLPVIVKNDFGLPAGTIVIVNDERRLYLVLDDGTSKQYRVAVGERAEVWIGRTFVSSKRENPDWNPVDGSPMVPGGRPDNPLGVRALYLDWGLLRIHGTSNPRSIGSSVSNGCIRMFNRDVIDLFEQTHIGAPVIAVNAIRDIPKFRSDTVTGKLPAWEGQRELWAERAKLEAEQRRLARANGGTTRSTTRTAGAGPATGARRAAVSQPAARQDLRAARVASNSRGP